MPSFVSTNGLAGDVMVIEGIISRRETEISALQERVIELENVQEEEADVIEKDIKRRIKDLEKQIKATTRERAKKLKELKIAHLKRKRPIIERIDELQQLNHYDRSLIAPIRKLPAELLGYIFQHHIDLDNSPWVLTLVSRSWRHTAMTTPSLWVHLLLFSAEYRREHQPDDLAVWRIDKRSWYSIGRRVVCHNLREVNVIVGRAGSLPLDVSISYRNENALVVHSVLGDASIARRVASLTIDDADPRGIDPADDVAGVTVGSFPLLHTLTISLASEELQNEILKSISSSSPQLKHLATYHYIPSSLDFPFWSKLRSINLNQGPNKEFLNNLLPYLGEVETLEGCPLRWPDDSTPEIALAKLTTLEVYCVPEYLHKLRLPALLRLSVNELYTRNPAVETNSELLISLPALEILEVTARSSSPWLVMLSAPYIRVFTMRHAGWGTHGRISLFRNIHFPAVQEFTLDYPCTDQVAISALECIPNAEKFVVSSSLYDGPWGLGILQRLADVENMLCPNMTHFTLGSPNNRVVANKTSARAHVRRAIKNRMDRGVNMVNFEIYFDAREESIQYA